MILLLLLLSTEFKLEYGKATIYWPKDGNSTHVRADAKPFTEEDGHIAHRELPIGTRGFLCNKRTKRCVRTIVKDRGPYGAFHPCGLPRTKSESKKFKKPRKTRYKGKCHWYQVQIELSKGWMRRADFDLTRPVSKAIWHRSLDEVIFIYEVNNDNSRHRRKLHAPPELQGWRISQPKKSSR